VTEEKLGLVLRTSFVFGFHCDREEATFIALQIYFEEKHIEDFQEGNFLST
jgi:hypothetical protein